MQGTVDVPVSPSSPEHHSKHDSSGRSIALGESASFYNGKNDNSDVRGENQDDVSCEEIIVRDFGLDLKLFVIIDAPLLSLGSAPTSEEASPSSRGGTPATRERRAKTKEASGEPRRRFGIRNRCEIKADRGELHQSRGNEVKRQDLTGRAFPQIMTSLIELLSSLPSPKLTHSTNRA